MAMFKLADTGFSVIPEGETKFRIVEVDDSKLEDFGKIEIKCETDTGKKHSERFNVTSEGGAKAFSFFVKVITDDWGLEEIDPQSLVGVCFEARVEHDVQPSTKDPNKTVTYVRLQDKKACGNWGEDTPKEVASAPVTNAEPATELSVDDILGL